MARYKDSVCRQCRRESVKLFLKGDRCFGPKCALERRQYSPGMHGQGRRSKTSEYGIQLREKQKMKRMYGLLEKQFRNIFYLADKGKGVTGDTLLKLLETRLDTIVYRMGFVTSRAEGRQLIQHGHFRVNGKKVSIPSYRVKAGDEITIKEKSQKIARIIQSMESHERRGVATWLELDKNNFKGKVKALPAREELTMPIQEQLVVELYSK
ncbi:MAG: 30S ribosomal protein S4 [Deltaproteobacteria bacterium RIFCSPLOWO2_02_FULL_50_16]|nr:MAG: 30S ribosomal protein S4 [Deltaproteobacteria bacterium GWA2_50_8]OGQ26911.1 MAG: 30S ribosomal protein S4 [Deltaproteobacteria bacterium RIFCSPHIGHO2_02_FULL_50_15]OGQ56173.1 MAG: 30S ribosomal protein S4 [Deltaproteobacteria bacterium RIFCSPLOWO2_02_FULL_50_16]OGQ67030.1 MAG: 30S ribosomal protein S4 [Deltaproteobacteria bacterium RIFCSPLOWO2_12_FULL_50_11]